mmetsp:Transcript_57900/g.148939  ORF Transcript_57900/g.148939 Transcript_57900/m.148939 type:complete len:452 (-) Transcript_57900:18-1373(-)
MDSGAAEEDELAVPCRRRSISESDLLHLLGGIAHDVSSDTEAAEDAAAAKLMGDGPPAGSGAKAAKLLKISVAPSNGSLADSVLSDPTQPEQWDDPGPALKAPRTPQSEPRSVQEQREWQIQEIARLTAQARAAHSRHVKELKMRRQRRFKSAPSKIMAPILAEVLTPGLPTANSCRNVSRKSTISTADGIANTSSPVVIFDWDDTLFPTTYLTEVVLSGAPSNAKYGRLPEDSPYAQALENHGQLVNDLLVAANSIASVVIVTLAARPWVENSSQWFLPNSGVTELLRDLDIQIYYAREHVSKRDKFASYVEEGVDLFMIAKRNAMMTCLRKLRRQHRKPRTRNVLSIGDSVTEENAIKEILWASDTTGDLCKTVKFISDPTLDVLGAELQLIKSWFDKLVHYSQDFHVSLEDVEDMNGVLPALLGADPSKDGVGNARLRSESQPLTGGE